MTKRELRYLFVISVLSLYQKRLIDSTNEHIALVEHEANEKLQKLVEMQIEADKKVLEVWEENADTLWHENQTLTQKLTKAQQRKKEAKRLARG